MKRRGRPMVAPFELLVCVLFIFVVLALTEKPVQSVPRIETRGYYAVTVTWAEGSNDDVDLWVEDPAGNRAWYASQDEGLMHLDADDLGTANSGTQTLPDGRKIVTRFNGERTVLRGVVEGEYTVNVHMYTKSDVGRTPVVVQLWSLRGEDRVLKQTRIVLVDEGQEETAFRFTIDAQGNAGHFNDLQKRFVGPATQASGDNSSGVGSGIVTIPVEP